MSDNVSSSIESKKIILNGQILPASLLNLSGNIKSSGQIGVLDYNKLKNLPSLNGITLEGSMISEDLYVPKVMFNTTEAWESDLTTISEKNTVYIYTDYQHTEYGTIAGIKIGDGLAYIVDLPFLDTVMQEHMNNTDIHVTPEEKEFWNSKHRGITYGETLILTEE